MELGGEVLKASLAVVFFATPFPNLPRFSGVTTIKKPYFMRADFKASDSLLEEVTHAQSLIVLAFPLNQRKLCGSKGNYGKDLSFKKIMVRQ